MDVDEILETLKLVKKYSKKRKFSQTVDLIINLKGLNLKNPEDNIKEYVILPHSFGKENKVGIFLSDELLDKAKNICDVIVHKDNFSEYKDPKKAKKLAKQVDMFVAQSNLMPDIAKFFGKVLGPIGKMPDPKTGAIVPPVIPELKPVIEKLKKIVRLQTKNELIIKAPVGKEDTKDDQIAENIMAVYNIVAHNIHDPKHKIKNIILKTTMGKPFIVGKKYQENELTDNKKIKNKKSPVNKPKKQSKVTKNDKA